MRVARVEEVVDGCVAVAPVLQARVRPSVRSDERRRRDTEEVLRVLLVLEQLRPRDAHQLDAHAHEADVVDVRRDVRPRPGEPHPRGVGLRLGEDPAPHVLREVVADGELATDDAVRLRVAAALEPARLPERPQLRGELVDDRLEVLLLPGLRPLFGEPETVVAPLEVDERRCRSRQRLAQRLVERRPEERIDAPLGVDRKEHHARQGIEESVPGCRRRQSEAGPRAVFCRSDVVCDRHRPLLRRGFRAYFDSAG